MTTDWTPTSIGEVTGFATGYTFSPKRQGHSVGEVPFLKVSDMNLRGNERWIRRANNFVSEETLREMRAKAWPKGTVIFPKVGAALLTEKRRILLEASAFDNNVMGLLPGPDVEPYFLYLYLTQVQMADIAQLGAVPSVNQSKVGAIPILLPPRPAQRRIVDLMEAFDLHREALIAEVRALELVNARSMSELLTRLPDRRPLGQIARARSGPSFSAADVHDAPRPDAVPVVGIPNTKADGTFDLARVGHVSGLSESVVKIDEHSLVLIRTNGNRNRIGNVYMPPAAAHGHAVSAFQFLMQVEDPREREFVFWVLREPGMQDAMSRAASGTTGLGNLAVKWLNAAPVPWTEDRTTRAEVSSLLRSQQDVIDELRQELAKFGRYRNALLGALLRREVEIPTADSPLVDVVA